MRTSTRCRAKGIWPPSYTSSVRFCPSILLAGVSLSFLAAKNRWKKHGDHLRHTATMLDCGVGLCEIHHYIYIL